MVGMTQHPLFTKDLVHHALQEVEGESHTDRLARATREALGQHSERLQGGDKATLRCHVTLGYRACDVSGIASWCRRLHLLTPSAHNNTCKTLVLDTTGQRYFWTGDTRRLQALVAHSAIRGKHVSLCLSMFTPTSSTLQHIALVRADFFPGRARCPVPERSPDHAAHPSKVDACDLTHLPEPNNIHLLKVKMETFKRLLQSAWSRRKGLVTVAAEYLHDESCVMLGKLPSHWPGSPLPASPPGPFTPPAWHADSTTSRSTRPGT
jgi:hypothetical protein